MVTLIFQLFADALPSFVSDTNITGSGSIDPNPSRLDLNELVADGVIALHQERPQADILMIIIVPVLRGPGSTEWEKFRHVAVEAHDPTNNQFVDVYNQEWGDDTWSQLRVHRERPLFIHDLTPLQWTKWPVSLQRAFQIVRDGGVMEPWLAVTVFPYEQYANRVVYMFIVADGTMKVAVDAVTGRRIIIRSDRSPESGLEVEDVFESSNHTAQMPPFEDMS